MLLARGLEELRGAGAGGHVPPSLPSRGFTWALLGGAVLELLPAASLPGMVLEGAEMAKETTGTAASKPAGKVCAPEETSTAAVPPKSPASGAAWGGRPAPSIVKDVNPEVLRSGVACLPGE